MTQSAATSVLKPRPAKEDRRARPAVVFRRFGATRMAVASRLVISVMSYRVAVLAPVITTFPRDAVDVTPRRAGATRDLQLRTGCTAGHRSSGP